MATGVTTNHLASIAAMKLYYHIPASSSAVVVSVDGGTTKNYLDMRDYEHFAAMVLNAVSTSSSGPTLVEIIAATDTAGTSATVILTSGTVASVTVGDNVFIECSAAQIKEVGDAAGLTLRYVTIRITTSNSSDKQAVFMGRFTPRFPRSGLTANNIT